MDVIQRDQRFRPPADRPVIATLGNFDALHRGHQAILDMVLRRARERPGFATLLTFDPHPLTILTHDRAPRLILAHDQKLRLLERWGLDAVVFLAFDQSMANLTAEEFVRQILVERIRVAEVFVGVDFRFGRRRSGHIEDLERLGREHGFLAASVPAVSEGNERISASRIRRLLGEGDIDAVNRLLGRPYALVGPVVRGAGRGRGLSFPTANIEPRNEVLPARGVYITETRWFDRRTYGLTNVGVRPTFGESRLTVESYLPDFAGDLYGCEVRLAFHRRLRDELTFPSADALREQIGRDLEAFRRFLAERGIVQPG